MACVDWLLGHFRAAAALRLSEEKLAAQREEDEKKAPVPATGSEEAARRELARAGQLKGGANTAGVVDSKRVECVLLPADPLPPYALVPKEAFDFSFPEEVSAREIFTALEMKKGTSPFWAIPGAL